MKKLIYSFLAIAGLFAFSACSSEDGLEQTSPQDGQMVTQTLTVEAPSGFANTRAGGNFVDSKLSGYQNCGSKAIIYLAMYKQQTNEDGTAKTDAQGKVLWDTTPVWKGKKAAEDGKATFTISYFQGKKVKMVGYATVGDAEKSYMNGDNFDLTNIQYPEPNYRWTINDESDDSFFGNKDGEFGNFSELTLTRPSCKVRIIATDWAAAKAEGVTSLTMQNTGGVNWIHTQSFNAMTGNYNGKTDGSITADFHSGERWQANEIPNYANENDNTEKTVFVQYFPGGNNERVWTIPTSWDWQFTFNWKYKDGGTGSKQFNWPALPLKRNRLITIKGKIFTSDNDFTVEIDDDIDNYYVKTIPVADASGNYTINNEGQFAGLMDIINENATTDINTTITLTQDLDLGSAAAKFPDIQLKSNSHITIDGNGHTVKGLTKPLFARVYNSPTITVKNITFDGLNVKSSGTGEAAVASPIAGWTEGSATYEIDGVTVKNCSFSAQFAGAILAWVNQGTTVTIKNCTVDNCTVGTWHAGGIIGYLTGVAIVDNCTVTKSEISSGVVLGTVAGNGKITISNINASDNKNGYFDLTDYVGRKASNTTTVIIDGEKK